MFETLFLLSHLTHWDDTYKAHQLLITACRYWPEVTGTLRNLVAILCTKLCFLAFCIMFSIFVYIFLATKHDYSCYLSSICQMSDRYNLYIFSIHVCRQNCLSFYFIYYNCWYLSLCFRFSILELLKELFYFWIQCTYCHYQVTSILFWFCHGICLQCTYCFYQVTSIYVRFCHGISNNYFRTNQNLIIYWAKIKCLQISG